MTRLLLINFILIQFFAHSQKINVKETFNFKITEVKGDLNNDKLDDKVVVMQDTVNEIAPFKLEMFFANSNADYKTIATSRKIIAPQYPNGRNGFLTGSSLENITIKKNIVIINYGLLRGHLEHKFRFQNGNFELIGFSEVNSGQGAMTTIDFNLSTGVRTEKEERCDIDKIISYTKKKILIRPLPKLQDVEPFENELY